MSTNLNIFETHPFTNSTLHLLSTISINKEIVAGRNIKIQVVIAHQKWPFLKCSHPVWISIMQVLLVCHKKSDVIWDIKWSLVCLCFLRGKSKHYHVIRPKIFSTNSDVTLMLLSAVVDGSEFWINCQQLKLLRKAYCLQLIQSSAPSTIMWCQSDIRISRFP